MKTTTTYEIVTRHSSEEEWTNDGIESSPGSNRFGTEAEAEEAIEELKGLGTDWAEAEYSVRVVDRDNDDDATHARWEAKQNAAAQEQGYRCLDHALETDRATARVQK